MKNFLIMTVALIATALTLGCAKDDVSSTGASSTYSISGGLGVGGNSPSSVEGSQKLGAMNSALANACSDGNIYKIYCVSFSDSPTAASGDVNCAGGSTGTYTVSGLPKNTPVGCFVQVSTDGTSYSTAGTIELKEEGSMSGNSNITAEGDMSMNITIATNGAITTEVTKDARKAPSSATKVDPTAFNGIYHMVCDNTKGGTLFSQGRCKCFLGEDQYSTHYNNQDECMSDPAGAGSKLSNVSMYVDINIYNGTANSDIVEDGKTYIKSGDQVQGVTVWAATDGSTTTMAGGEGLTQFSADMGITFSDSQATTAISWSSTANLDGSSGTTASTVGTVPSNTANVGAWQSWLQSFVASAITNSEVDCTGKGISADAATDAGCLQYVTDNVLDNVSSATLPRVHFQPKCDHSGCSATVNEGRIWVEGIEFDYNFASWSGSQASVAVKTGGHGATPRNRYVFEQWHNFPSGGGGFTQKDGRHRWYPCTSGTASGDQVSHSSCTNSGDGLECFMEEELGIKMLPTTTSGTYDMVFESRNVVYGGQFHLGSNTSGPVFNADAAKLCRDKVSRDGAFMATATKQ